VRLTFALSQTQARGLVFLLMRTPWSVPASAVQMKSTVEGLRGSVRDKTACIITAFPPWACCKKKGTMQTGCNITHDMMYRRMEQRVYVTSDPA
jgi:hypothetical protein